MGEVELKRLLALFCVSMVLAIVGMVGVIVGIPSFTALVALGICSALTIAIFIAVGFVFWRTN